MTDASELLRLAGLCETASGPDRLLDAEIFAEQDYGAYRTGAAVPAYTASLDAAMTLVPEGWHTELATQDRHTLRWKWTLRGGFGVRSETRAATPALALCAASLRAIASTQEPVG